MEEPERVARDYVSALARRNLEAARPHLADDLSATMHGLAGFDGPTAVVDYFATSPDWHVEVLRTVTVDDAVALRSRATGMFAGAPSNGLEPTGARLDFQGVDEATGRPRPPHRPQSAFNEDDARARESLLRLAGLDLEAAWPGHGQPLRGDVRRTLERAAAA